MRYIEADVRCRPRCLAMYRAGAAGGFVGAARGKGPALFGDLVLRIYLAMDEMREIKRSTAASARRQ